MLLHSDRTNVGQNLSSFGLYVFGDGGGLIVLVTRISVLFLFLILVISVSESDS